MRNLFMGLFVVSLVAVHFTNTKIRQMHSQHQEQLEMKEKLKNKKVIHHS